MAQNKSQNKSAEPRRDYATSPDVAKPMEDDAALAREIEEYFGRSNELLEDMGLKSREETEISPQFNYLRRQPPDPNRMPVDPRVYIFPDEPPIPEIPPKFSFEEGRRWVKSPEVIEPEFAWKARNPIQEVKPRLPDQGDEAPGVYAQGGLVNMPGYYQRGGLGMPQMSNFARDAYYGARNEQRAVPRLPHLAAIHMMRPAAIRPLNIRPPNLRGGMGPGIRPPTGRISARPAAYVRPPGGMNIRSPAVHLIHSSVPGRVDRIPMRARTGSYVIPADVVSGLGQGNTYAGAKMWGQAIAHSAGPAGSVNTIRPGHFRAPALHMGHGRLFARGGATDEGYTPIITAGGECLVDPELVHALGRGDPEVGKKTLSDSVMKVRRQVMAHMRSLPPPVK